MKTDKSRSVEPDSPKQPIEMDIEMGRILYFSITQRDAAMVALRTELTNLRPNKRRKALLRVRTFLCSRRCPACPHTAFQALNPDKSVERLTGRTPQLRSLGFFRNIHEISQLAQTMERHEQIARKIATLVNFVCRRAFELFQDMQIFLDETGLQAADPAFYPPDPIGPAYLLGFSSLAFTVERCDQLLRALQDHIYQYSSTTIHTRYHKTKPGVLGLKIEHQGRNSLTPAVPRWVIYLRGHERQWFSSHEAVFQNRSQDGTAPKKISIRNTPWVLTRTGNRRHIHFYQAAQRHLRSILTFKTRIAALSDRLTSDSALIMKRYQNQASLEPIRYPVSHLKTETPEDAIQLINQGK
ncbi:hypothetical protein HAP94_10810 [Acidithiobacillus ferrivorans]|nr:hypothetical protein [Acidithiobacillus ferrivorans]